MMAMFFQDLQFSGKKELMTIEGTLQ